MPWTAGGAEGGPDLVVDGQHLPRAVEQEAAVAGEVDGAALAAEEEGLAEQGLQALHLHGDGGLGTADAFGGAGKAAFLGDVGEGAEEGGVDGGCGFHSINIVDERNQCNSFLLLEAGADSPLVIQGGHIMSQTISSRSAVAAPLSTGRFTIALRRVAAAWQRSAMQRDLSTLDARMLKDLGLSRAQAGFVSERPILSGLAGNLR